MANFRLQEMYLTEYNRLITAIKRHFAGLDKNKIEDITDWLNTLPVDSPIDEIDLNGVSFNGVSSGVIDYSKGLQTIKIKKDNDLIASNIIAGKTIEGISGTAVDATGFNEKLNDTNIVSKLALVDSTVEMPYYNTSSNSIEWLSGQATLRTDQTIEGMIYDTTEDAFEFSTTDTNKGIYFKNFKLKVPEAVIEESASKDRWTIRKGYVTSDQTLIRVSESDKQLLRENLQWGSAVLGQTAANRNIINTTAYGDEPSTNHIIAGQTYFRNGESYSGTLSPINVNNLIKHTDYFYGTSATPNVSTIEGQYTTLHIPNVSYNNSGDIYYDITDLRPENIKNGKTIMGIAGSAHMYDTYTGSTTIILGEDTPTGLPTKETMVETDIAVEIDETAINSSKIRYGEKVLGIEGSFTSSDDEAVTYIAHDGVLHAGTDNNGAAIEYYESENVAIGTYTFIDGSLCKGINPSLAITSYTGSTNITLGDTLPAEMETSGKKLINNITFQVDPDVITPENITYGKTILGIEGTFSKHEGPEQISSSSVLKDYVGFVNGNKITGAIEVYRNKKINSSLKGASIEAGYYEGAYVEPIKFKNRAGTIYTSASEEGRNAIATMFQKNCELYTGRTGEVIVGDGSLVLTASTADEMTAYLGTALQNEVVKFVGDTYGSYKKNNYYEIVTEEEAGLAPGSTVPAYDPLIKARDMADANIKAEHVLKDQIGYGKRGERIVGGINVYDSSSSEYSMVLDATETSWNTYPYKLNETGGYYPEGWKVSIDKDKINPRDIKAGATIFGVTGTYDKNLGTGSFTVPERGWSVDSDNYMVNEFNIDSDPTAIATGLDGWDKVVVHTKIKAKNNALTENGIYDIIEHAESGESGWNQVEVAVPLAGKLDTWVTSADQTFTFDAHKAAGETNAAWQTVKVKVPLHDNVILASNTTWEPVGKNPSGIPYIGASKVKVEIPYNGTATFTASTYSRPNIFTFDEEGDSDHVAWTQVNVNVPIIDAPPIITQNDTILKAENYYHSGYGCQAIGFDNIKVSIPLNGTLEKTVSENTTFTFANDNEDASYQAWQTVKINVDVSGKLQDKTVRSNGPVEPDAGYIGLKKVTVDVPQTSLLQRQITLAEIKKKTELNPGSDAAWNKITFGDYTVTSKELSVSDLGKKDPLKESNVLWDEIDTSKIKVETGQYTVNSIDTPHSFITPANTLYNSIIIDLVHDECAIEKLPLHKDDNPVTYTPKTGTCGFKSVKLNCKVALPDPVSWNTLMELNEENNIVTAPENIYWSTFSFDSSVLDKVTELKNLDLLNMSSRVDYGTPYFTRFGIRYGDRTPIYLEDYNLLIYQPGTNSSLKLDLVIPNSILGTSTYNIAKLTKNTFQAVDLSKAPLPILIDMNNYTNQTKRAQLDMKYFIYSNQIDSTDSYWYYKATDSNIPEGTDINIYRSYKVAGTSKLFLRTDGIDLSDYSSPSTTFNINDGSLKLIINNSEYPVTSFTVSNGNKVTVTYKYYTGAGDTGTIINNSSPTTTAYSFEYVNNSSNTPLTKQLLKFYSKIFWCGVRIAAPNVTSGTSYSVTGVPPYRTQYIYSAADKKPYCFIHDASSHSSGHKPTGSSYLQATYAETSDGFYTWTLNDGRANGVNNYWLFEILVDE